MYVSLPYIDESANIALESLSKNVTDNRAFRKKKSKQQRKANMDTGKETDSDQTLLTDDDRVKKTRKTGCRFVRNLLRFASR